MTATGLHLIDRATAQQRIKKAWQYIESNFYVETKIIPISKLLYTQTFLKQDRIKHYTSRVKRQPQRNIYTPKENFINRVFREGEDYVIITGNCRSYCATQLGFKHVKARVYSAEIERFWNRRLFHKGKPIRKRINEIIVLKTSYDHHQNNRKLDWLILETMIYLRKHGLGKNDFFYEGVIVDINKNDMLTPRGYVYHDKRQELDGEPLILLKDNFSKNTYHVIDGVERLQAYKQARKSQIEAWVFTLSYFDLNTETWINQVSNEFNMTFND